MPGQVANIRIEGLATCHRVIEPFPILDRQTFPDRFTGPVALGKLEQLPYLQQRQSIILELLDPFDAYGVPFRKAAMFNAIAVSRFEEAEFFIVPDGSRRQAEHPRKFAYLV